MYNIFSQKKAKANFIDIAAEYVNKYKEHDLFL